VTQATRRLAAYLSARVNAGQLAIPEVTHAARQFLELCKTGILLPMLLRVTDECPPERIEANVTQAVRVFLAAYQVKP
jgi:hypothetical protein